jgi:hypothetical protein
MNKFLLLLFLFAIPSGVRASQMATPAPIPVSVSPQAVPDNKWTKIGDIPPDPFGRELEPGRGAYLCFEEVNNQLLRYGGYTPTDDNSLWSYDLSARKWENPLRSSYDWPAPSDRPGAGAWWSMAWDSKRKVVWLFGGSGVAERASKTILGDTWKYDPAKKSFTLAGSKNPPSYSGGCRIVYDSKNDRLIRAPAYDGEWSALHNRDATWVYDPDKNAWEKRETPGSPKNALACGFVFEPNLGKAVYLKPGGGASTMETWTFDAATNKWEKLSSKDNPPSAVVPGVCYDSAHKLIVLYGGVGSPKEGYGYLYRGGGVQLSETWTLDLAKGQWNKLDVGAPVLATLPAAETYRFEITTAMTYDAKNNAVVLAEPTIGVWALRLHPDGTSPLPELKLAALPEFEKPLTVERIYPQAPPNKKLVDLEENAWVQLNGGPSLGGGEVPMIYDEATGFLLKYGGCNNGGTTFASGYGNDLSAYDPATERWIALRWVDPCGAPRPKNGCTRFYGYDPVHKCDWFAGGTAGNNLPYSFPIGSSGTNGTWRYDGLKDRFDYVPTAGAAKVGAGVVCCFDRSANLLVTVPKAYGEGVSAFDPEKKAWRTVSPKIRAADYTFPCYVDSLKGMFVIELAKDGFKTLLFDPTGGQWRELAAIGESPAGDTRPVTAYDPGNDVVLCVIKDKTFAYTVKDNAWKKLETKTAPRDVNEMLVFDRRHKVFLGTRAMGGSVWAFRYKK